VRIVVVGAGVGGLAAAARLATAGHRVTVCEAAPTVGGKLGWYARDGFAFDTGPSLLTMPQVFEDLFAATGDPLGTVVDLRPLDPIARYRFADPTDPTDPTGPTGVTVDAFADDAAFADELDAKLGRGAGADWTAFAERARRIWAATSETFLEQAMPGPSGLARMAARRPRDIALIAPGTTLRGLGERYLRDGRLRQLLDRYATYTGSDPRRAPAALAAVPHAERAFGGWYVSGGLRRLGLAIADRAVERGARLLTDCAVTQITRRGGGRADGVRLADGALLPADAVVAGVDAQAVYSTLLRGGRSAEWDATDGFRPGTGLGRPAGPGTGRARRSLRRAVPSMSGFVLLLALRGRTPGLAHHTVLFPGDYPAGYDAEMDAVFGGRLATDPTVYVAAPDDPALAPPGDEAWFVLVNAARHAPARSGGSAGTVDWDRPGLADAYGDTILAVLAARGLDVRDRVRWRKIITPADLERRTGAVGGSIYGTSSNGARSAFLRPANVSRVPGMFLVGGSSHPGGGLPLVAMSARIVADLIGPA
jgi:phytoene desaturase